MAAGSTGSSCGRSCAARRHGVVAAALLVFAAAFTSGCRSKEATVDPLDVKPIVLKTNVKAAPEAPDAAAKLARAQAELDAAQAAWRSGDALAALATANHAILEGVPSELEPAFRDLRAKARAAVVASKICRVRALAEKDAVADGDEIRVRIAFSNVSGATLRVPRSQKGTSDALLLLTIAREDYDVYGNARSSDFTLPVPVAEDLVLDPGQTREERIVVPADAAKLTHRGFSILEVRGTFRPVSIRVGDSEFFDAIPVEPARVRVFMKGYEPLAADPLGSLRKSVEKRSPPHLLTCAELLAPTDRAEARTILTAAKEKDEELAPAIDAALARLQALDAGR